MLATMVIFARESLEASMIVAIILSYLRQIHRSDQAFWVWVGIAAALAVDAGAGVIVWTTIHRYSGTSLQTGLEGTTYFVAALILTGMSFWMKRQGRALKHQLQDGIDRTLASSAKWPLALLAAVTVGREGLETVVFVLALTFRTAPGPLLVGAAGGLLLGFGMSYWLYRLGRRIPLRSFFTVFGVLLLVFADALISDGVEDYQALRWIPWGRTVLWHTGRYLRESGAIGDVLHTFLGYAQAPSILQFSVYLGFLGAAVFLFLRSPGRRLAKSQTG